MPSGRFFGWVIGGSLPAALASDWLVSAWDLNACLRYGAPAMAAIEGIRVTPQASVSEPMLASTRRTQSEVAISASRVMSQAAPHTRARASESSTRDRPSITVASERSSRRILA